MSSAIARNRPTAKEKKTVDAAKTNVQRKIERNGLRTSGLWMIWLKLRKPTCVFQPGSSSSLPLTNDPRPLSWKTLPSVIRTKTLCFES